MSLLCFCSCGDDKQYDIDGNEGVIYISELKGLPLSLDAKSILITPKTVQGSVIAKFPVRASMPVKENTTVHLEINNDLVESYNEKYGTSYKVLDASFWVMANSDVCVSNKSIESDDSVSIYMPEDKFRSIDAGSYLIPIELKSSNGRMPLTKAKERTAYYLTVNVAYRFNISLTTPNKIDGDLPEDRSKWTISYTNNVSDGALTDLLDGDISTFAGGSMKNGDYWTIDLGEVHPKVLGIYLNYYNTKHEWASIKISTSIDNKEWFMQGYTPEKASSDSPNDENTVKFNEPVEARYIRLEAKGGFAWNTDNTWLLSELNIYESVTQNSNVILVKPSEMQGNLVDDRSKWTISCTGDYSSGPLANLLDGNIKSYSGGYIKEEQYWIIDLGEVNSNILGVYLHYYSGQYDWASIKVSTSADNKKWIKQGRTSKQTSDTWNDDGIAKFATPVEARYIQLEVYGGLLHGDFMWFLTELNIYK